VAEKPFVEAMAAALFDWCGLLPLGGEDSECVVSGVKPFAIEALRLSATLCEL